jgi:hypothetical protein
LTSNDFLLSVWDRLADESHEQTRLLSTLRQTFGTYQANVRNQKDLELLLPRLERALEITMEERKVFTDRILAAIAGRVNELYETVHPGEGLSATIGIPRIVVQPAGEVRSGFHPFTLDLAPLRFPPVADELWIHELRTNQGELFALGRGSIEEGRLEDYVVSGLVDFDDISYDAHADLLYELAAQTVAHFQTYLTEEEIYKVLRVHQRQIAESLSTCRCRSTTGRRLPPTTSG